MNKSNVRYLVGAEMMEVKPLPIYSELVCDFLDELSKELRKNTEAKAYPDVLTFAFWCRKGNIVKLKEEKAISKLRMGRGIIFHIAPSNVPINFAYSLAFGMLAGNGNIVRVSQKDAPQIELVCNVLREILRNKKYEILCKQNQVVSYGHDKELNDYYSSICNVRVIWGGDLAIKEVRQSPLMPRSTELTFADRYSFGIFKEEEMEKLGESELSILAQKFYNDTYLMDQNACSSPYFILWIPSKKKKGRERFWKEVSQEALKYDFTEKKAVDKYNILCEQLVLKDDIEYINKWSNRLYVVGVKDIPECMEEYRGKFGLFFETELGSEEKLCKTLSPKFQTCVAYGIDKKKLLDMFMKNYVLGVDRIVSIGEAIDMNVNWDGYDVINSLSRGIEVLD